MRGRPLAGVPWVGFLIDEVALAVEARLVKTVTWSRGLIPVPFVKRSVAGVIVRDGRIVPVLDLALAPSAWNRMPRTGGSQVVIVGEGEMEAGILARATETFRAAQLSAAPGGGSLAWVRESLLEGIVEVAGRTYGVLRISVALHAAGVPQTFSG